MRAAAPAGDRVDRLDFLAPQVVKDLGDHRDRLVLLDANAQKLVELFVGGVDQPGRLLEQRDLVSGLDLACVHHQRLGIYDSEPFGFEGAENWKLDDVDTKRLVLKPVSAEQLSDLLGVRCLKLRPRRRSSLSRSTSPSASFPRAAR